jgi:DNA-binding beta-propeller fold protein YncE
VENARGTARRAALWVSVAGAVLALAGHRPARRPGPEGGGVTLLPNGWRIAPVGRHITVGNLPLALAESPDGRYVIVGNNGYSAPALTVVDLEGFAVAGKVPMENAWLGLAWHPDGDRLYASGAAANTVQEFRFEKGKLTPSGTFSLGSLRKGAFVGGLAVRPDGSRLYAVNVLGRTVSSLELKTGQVTKTVELAAEPYTCAVSPDGRTLFVSLWGGAKVLLFDAGTLEKNGEIPVGEHPNAMVLSKDGSRLFVACANTNAVWAVDLSSRTAKEQISVALYPKEPAGSTPNGLGLSPDGRRLLVADAGNNTVAVVDIARPGSSRVEGFLPTGWYPTAAQFSRDGKRIFILSGKGLASHPNPRGPQPGIPAAEGQYIGALLQGALSIVPTPDAAALAGYTKRVYGLTPYTDAIRLSPARPPASSPIPEKVGGASPIRHVFYLIRENRTYDQILGDLPEGNGDPNLCLFGAEVTPNAHALAREFVLLDNFYVNSEVSYNGHDFSTGAYATDFVEKIWPMNYAGRGGRYLSGRGGALRNPHGNITAPAAGYIWDACQRAGVSFRSYGEFVMAPPRGEDDEDRPAGEASRGPFLPAVPGLEGHICPDYPPFDLSVPDSRRVEVWSKEFRQYEENGQLPALSILWLPSDHTAGARPGFSTPRSMIAENDQALSRVVETIAKSRYWKDSAIFVLEDDAQNGPDHVDAHRSVALVVSPYAKRRVVDSGLYTTCGVLRTIELILGLPPMSQCDAAAMPLSGVFQSESVATGFERRAARVPLDQKNAPTAYGAEASLAMDLEEADRAPDLELNEIIWRSVRGADSPMPPPVRAAFLRALPETDE